jgi:hypothetical protein
MIKNLSPSKNGIKYYCMADEESSGHHEEEGSIPNCENEGISNGAAQETGTRTPDSRMVGDQSSEEAPFGRRQPI